MAQSAAGRLFVERARAAVPSFEVNERNAGAIAEICRRLDGVPLAVELAAARVPVLGVEQIASRLDDRFRVLTGGSRTAPRRHQTLRAAVDWSYDQLSAAEQRLFNQLSVFAAGWTLEAAEAVGSVDSSEWISSGFSSSISAGAPGEHTRPLSVGGGEPFDLLDLLAQLVAKSLIVADPRPDGQVCYRQLQTLRIYAKEQLERSGQLGAIQRRHAEYFLGLAERAEAELRGPHMSTWLDRLEADHDNLRFALSLYLQEGNIERAQRLGGALWLFWQQRGYLEEGWNWVTRILALPGANARTQARAKLLLGAGLIAHSRADEHVSIALCEESLELCHALGDYAQVTWLLAHLGRIARLQYDFPRARALFGDGLAVARAAGIRTGEAEVLLNLGRLEYLEGDLNAAATTLECALSISNEMGHSQGAIFALRYLGEVAYQRGDYGLARSNIEASLAHAREQRDPWRTAWAAGPLCYVLVVQGQYELARRTWVENLLAWRQIGNMNHFASTLEGLASLAGRTGALERALQLVGAAASIRRANAILMLPEARIWLDGWLPAARAKLGESRATAAWAKGEAMSVQEVIAYASDSPSSPGTSGFPAASELTRREREVAVLVSSGLTDRDIAHALVISAHTAHTHVRNILGKLGLQSRVQIATWAVEEGLSAGRNESPTKDT